MVTASKATVPTITDQASAMQLSQCAKNLASALAELRTASQKVSVFLRLRSPDTKILRRTVVRCWCPPVLHLPPQAQEACGPLEIDNALSTVRKLEKDIQESKASAEEGRLRPLPGETVSPPAPHQHQPITVKGLAQRWATCGSRATRGPIKSLIRPTEPSQSVLQKPNKEGS